jgi:hypothetical protein
MIKKLRRASCLIECTDQRSADRADLSILFDRTRDIIYLPYLASMPTIILHGASGPGPVQIEENLLAHVP